MPRLRLLPLAASLTIAAAVFSGCVSIKTQSASQRLQGYVTLSIKACVTDASSLGLVLKGVALGQPILVQVDSTGTSGDLALPIRMPSPGEEFAVDYVCEPEPATMLASREPSAASA